MASVSVKPVPPFKLQRHGSNIIHKMRFIWLPLPRFARDFTEPFSIARRSFSEKVPSPILPLSARGQPIWNWPIPFMSVTSIKSREPSRSSLISATKCLDMYPLPSLLKRPLVAFLPRFLKSASAKLKSSASATNLAANYSLWMKPIIFVTSPFAITSTSMRKRRRSAAKPSNPMRSVANIWRPFSKMCYAMPRVWSSAL